VLFSFILEFEDDEKRWYCANSDRTSTIINLTPLFALFCSCMRLIEGVTFSLFHIHPRQSFSTNFYFKKTECAFRFVVFFTWLKFLGSYSYYQIPMGICYYGCISRGNGHSHEEFGGLGCWGSTVQLGTNSYPVISIWVLAQTYTSG
jgi:hypothetical protein